ncbi:hypothetical protein FXB40_36400 [Bradyrhizobium rifense]|uniref:Glycosyltransferase RgtA/B/C/D-like domain-containing protein n=1 Tax=Bradyrhizobium rifense TaxID=515499 RepID=A0A5D3K2A0_9BRAD|nr:hypothetical protein [Bradyrhizobium rifense]TYL89381.1 hypothetical protein FXB40_36400 [Bradyrhizobium rifense]
MGNIAFAGMLASITAMVAAGLLVRLNSFPGLHGDEAWVGLRALEQQARGMFTLRGMNGYTGSLFPEIVSLVFSIIPASVGSLRLASAILNGLALGLTALAFWKRGAAALYFALAMGSSLLFLFYSRVAWEVNALQNLLLALVLLTLPHLLERGRSPHRWLFLLLLAFSLGCWSHAIFIAAALSFAAATLLVALTWPGESSAKLLLIGQLNLLVQIVLCGRHFFGDGAFVTRALPAMLAGLGLIALATRAYVRVEGHLLPHTIRALTNRRVARVASIVIVGFVVLSLAASPIGDVSFFGTVSGMILLERVVSYLPSPIEMIALHLRMVLLLALFAAAALRSLRSKPSEPEQLMLPLFCLWTIAYFPALRLSIASVADRYYIIPQFLFFVSIALAIDGFRANWKMLAIALLLAGFVHAQVTMVREAFRDEDRPPFELFDYAGYTDTSRHFMRLDSLTNELKSRAACRVESSSFFIAQPMRFLMAVGQPCTGNAEVRVEYCAACLAPVRGFELQLRK